MSLIHLSSIGQRPDSFFNSFPNGIQLGTGAEVALVGYSGNLNGEANTATGEVYDIVIQEGQNDTMTVFHGENDYFDAEEQLYYPPHNVTVDAGVYTPDQFSFELADKLNQAERISCYKGNWLVTYDAVLFKYTITAGAKLGAPPGNGLIGDVINYAGGSDGVTGGGGAACVLTPHNPLGADRLSFLDTVQLAVGDSMQAKGDIAAPPSGCILEFTTIAATLEADVQYSLCMVPKQMASKMDFDGLRGPQENGGGPTTNNNLVYVGGTVPELDFAYGASGAQDVGFCTHGLTIMTGGVVGIIEAKTQNVTGNMKDPVNWTVRPTATIINIAAAGLKKLGMSFRMDNVPAPPALIVEYLVFDAGVWSVVGETVVNGPPSTGDHGSLRYSTEYYAGVVVSPECAARATSLPITFSRTKNGVDNGGAAADGPDETLLTFLPLDDIQPPNNISNQSGVTTASRHNNKLGMTLGYQETSQKSSTAFTVGFISTQALGTVVSNGDYSPLLITCKDLPIVGYVGGAKGTTAALLGIGRVRGNEISYGFSGEVAEHWLQLRNTEPITLYKLGIDIKTETMKEYVGLEPNFSCWLKFRSNVHSSHLKGSTMMGIQNAFG